MAAKAPTAIGFSSKVVSKNPSDRDIRSTPSAMAWSIPANVSEAAASGSFLSLKKKTLYMASLALGATPVAVPFA
ncbi:hypothetical protein PVL29_003227 [Vitis rotundifolia]|uniref:Uncharacterized protein n=1 Tax=Vitis rotundifolia TaxID=103349 RepID=A0AA39E2S7_VITRO|nr:hypothetical protein PVL29_003227 [Vitis rotundifolia]